MTRSKKPIRYDALIDIVEQARSASLASPKVEDAGDFLSQYGRGDKAAILERWERIKTFIDELKGVGDLTVIPPKRTP